MGVGAGGVDDRAQPGDVVGRQRGAEGGVEAGGVGRRGAVERQGDQHGALALDQVVAGGLAGRRRVAVHAQQVVAELEGLTEREAVRRQLPQHVRCRAGERGADVERTFDRVLGGLEAQHRHRGLDVGPAAGLHGHVEELARDHLGPAPVEQLERRRHPVGGQPAASQQLVGPREQQVAEQDGRGGAVLLRVAAPPGLPVRRGERAVGRRPAPPGVRGVHVVVVDQGARVQQLQGRARAQQRLLVLDVRLERAVAPPAERRPEPLATGHRTAGLLEERGGVGPERGDPSGHLVEEAVEDLLEPLPERTAVPRGHAARLVGDAPP